VKLDLSKRSVFIYFILQIPYSALSLSFSLSLSLSLTQEFRRKKIYTLAKNILQIENKSKLFFLNNLLNIIKVFCKIYNLTLQFFYKNAALY